MEAAERAALEPLTVVSGVNAEDVQAFARGVVDCLVREGPAGAATDAAAHRPAGTGGEAPAAPSRGTTSGWAIARCTTAGAGMRPARGHPPRVAASRRCATSRSSRAWRVSSPRSRWTPPATAIPTRSRSTIPRSAITREAPGRDPRRAGDRTLRALRGAHRRVEVRSKFAVRAPARVAALVLDGLLLLTEAERRGAPRKRYCPKLRAGDRRQPPGARLGHAARTCTSSSRGSERAPRGPARRRGGGSAFPGAGDARTVPARRGRVRPRLRGPPSTTTASPRCAPRPDADRRSRRGERRALRAARALPGKDLPANVTVGGRPRRARRRPRSAGGAPRARPRGGGGAPGAGVAAPSGARITRGYAATSHGRLHLRQQAGGSGRALVTSIHGSPTSAAMPRAADGGLARSRPVYARSTPSATATPTSRPRARQPALLKPPRRSRTSPRCWSRRSTTSAWAEFDLYGTHTGAAIAMEASLLRAPRAPARHHPRGALADALDEATVAEFLERYFIDLTPRSDGSHLRRRVELRARLDAVVSVVPPRPGAATCRGTGVYDAEALHRYALEVPQERVKFLPASPTPRGLRVSGRASGCPTPGGAHP